MRRFSFQPTRESLIPPGAVKVADKATNAVAYIYETARGPCAIGFIGKANKPAMHFRFTSPAAREKRVADFFASARASVELKAEMKAKRERPHNLQVGHILVSTWGYDETAVNFYEVTAVPGPHTVDVRPIASETVKETGWCTGKSVPVPGAYTGETSRHRVSYGDCVKISDCQRASLWDGRPKNWSAYA